jgi:phosphoglycolate phosphatase-like HAD superfamily hydrolase
MLRWLCALILAAAPLWAQETLLPSWNDGEVKSAILSFVADVTDESADTFVPPEDRIAVFDNDGTLWSEQPVYFQFLFAMDRAKALAAADPAWASSDVLKAAAAGDLKAVVAGGEEALLELVGATHAGLPVEDFTAAAAEWMATARHSETGLRYDQMTFQPMIELLDFMRANGFRTYIVSGGGVDFMRAYAEGAYGIPPENVVGSLGKASYEVVDGAPEVMKDAGIAFIDDKDGKPVGIARHIGQRPVFAAGNSDGDYQMLQWTTAGEGPRMGILIHHTDAVREWAYDHPSAIGQLFKALEDAPAEGWVVVDMKRDWATIWTGGAGGRPAE